MCSAGFGVVICGVTSTVTIITHIRGLITPLLTTHEPSSTQKSLSLTEQCQGLMYMRYPHTSSGNLSSQSTQG